MRNVLLILFVLLGTNVARCQFVVSDPTLLSKSIASWAEQLKQAQQSYAEIQKQSGYLKDAANNLKKVNNSVKTVREIDNLIKQQDKILDNFKVEISRVETVATVDYDISSSYVRRINRLQERYVENIAHMLDLISDDFFTMSDGERLVLLEQRTKENDEIIEEFETEQEKFNHINLILEQNKKIMRMEKKYNIEE